MGKLSNTILHRMNHLLLPTLPLGAPVDIVTELDYGPLHSDEYDNCHQIILITPYWQITRMYTDKLPGFIHEMTFSRLNISFYHRFIK